MFTAEAILFGLRGEARLRLVRYGIFEVPLRTKQAMRVCRKHLVKCTKNVTSISNRLKTSYAAAVLLPDAVEFQSWRSIMMFKCCFISCT